MFFDIHVKMERPIHICTVTSCEINRDVKATKTLFYREWKTWNVFQHIIFQSSFCQLVMPNNDVFVLTTSTHGMH